MPTVAVVGLLEGEGEPLNQAALEEALREVQAAGRTVLTGEELVGALAEQPEVRWVWPQPESQVTFQEASKLLQRASQLEADWEVQEANAIRKDLMAKIAAAPPDPRLLQVGVYAAHDLVAGYVSEQHLREAEAVALESLRLFGDVPPDPQRYPPNVRKVLDAAAQVA